MAKEAIWQTLKLEIMKQAVRSPVRLWKMSVRIFLRRWPPQLNFQRQPTAYALVLLEHQSFLRGRPANRMKTTDAGYEIIDALKTSRSQLQETMNAARIQQQSMYVGSECPGHHVYQGSRMEKTLC
jgi:hypothetical protein